MNQDTSLKNVVIGVSQGGVLASTALAFMEKSNFDHKTGLFVSIDTPHFGGSIPIGE